MNAINSPLSLARFRVTNASLWRRARSRRDAGPRGTATLAASLLLAAAAGCGGSSDSASIAEVVAGRQSGPTHAVRTDSERSTVAGKGSPHGAAGASSSAPAAPALTLALVGAQLRLSWVAVSGAAYYRLFANADGVSGFTRLGLDFPADQTGTALDAATHRPHWDKARYLIEACNSAGCTPSNSVTTFGLRPPAAYLKHLARGRFAQTATTPAAADVEAASARASTRLAWLPSGPALAATQPEPSHRSAGAAPPSARACARCLPR